MALTDQKHTVRFPLPDLIVRGVAHTLYAPVYLDGALVSPSTATVTVYNASNTAAISAASASLVSSVMEYAIGSGDLSSQDLGDRWRVEWALTLSGGAILTPRNDAALVRNGLWPVISDVDIARRMPSLDTSAASVITTATNYQDSIDEAWTQINLRLIQLGNRPNLILEPSALRQAHLDLAIALIFEGRLASRLNVAYQELAARFRRDYERGFNGLTPTYDTSDSGQADARRRAAVPTVWLSGGRNSGGWY